MAAPNFYCIYLLFVHLRLVRGRIVDRIVQTDALMQRLCLLDDQITHRNHITQLTQMLTQRRFEVELFGLFEDDFEPSLGSFESEVRADDADVIAHDLRAELRLYGVVP